MSSTAQSPVTGSSTFEIFTVREVLEREAARRGTARSVAFDDAPEWTWADALVRAYQAANALRARGVERDDAVMVLVAGGAAFFQAWWGINTLGAVMVAANPAWDDQTLAGIVADTQCRTVVTSGAAGHQSASVLELRAVDAEELSTGSQFAPELSRPIEGWEVFAINYTSGTTGRPKGACNTYTQLSRSAQVLGDFLRMVDDDVLLADRPLFQYGGQGGSFLAAARGGSIRVATVPPGEELPATARRTGATVAVAHGSMPARLERLLATDADLDSPLRALSCHPMVSDPAALKARLGLEVLVQMYGSTETGSLMFTENPPPNPLTCGRPRPGVEIRIVDPHDVEVPNGTVGEFVARPYEPWEIAASYAGRPADTARAWRNGWYHTGDAGWRDDAGNYYYVDRLAHLLPPEELRIPSAQAEIALLAHPAVREVAYVRAPEPYSDHVKAFAVLEADAQVKPEELFEFLLGRSVIELVPRFFEIIDALPKTASTRVKKIELRARGNTSATWDAHTGAFHDDDSA